MFPLGKQINLYRQQKNDVCEFFIEFCANMYMVAIISIKHIDNEIINSMYMMVKHVHDMYMS